MAIDQNEFKKEQKRVDKVVEVIEYKENKLVESTGGLKEDIIDIRKRFWEDVTVNVDEPDDIVESHATIKQQAEMLAERERSHKHYHKELKTLDRLKQNPYFGRIDFKEASEQEIEQVYLGIASLMDETNESFLIYDWRAPISSLYYDYTPGPAQYETPEETVKGNMELKRQFIIRNSQIKSVFDTGVTIGDELLQEVLGNRSDTHMKSIVATIQKEQNKIIRDDSSRLLVVQGVAGSGKTSAALQRVAYLLYRYRQTLNANNILLFSPNPLFNSYVASVLPELGEENMEQKTFQQYLEAELSPAFTVEDPFNQIEYTLSGREEEHYQIRMASIHLKSSLKFKRIMDDYIQQLGLKGMIFRNIKFRGKRLVTAQAIHDFFYSLDASQSITFRMEQVEAWILKELKKFERQERKKVWVNEAINLLDKGDYLEVDQAIEAKDGFHEDSFDDIEQEEARLSRLVVHRHFKPLYKKVKQLKFINIQAIYMALFKETFSSKPRRWKEIAQATINQLSQHQIYYEDATPYLYLKGKIEGRYQNTAIRHVFLDEAQDYSPFQIALLKEFFPKSKMTVLGDFNQAIYPHTENLTDLLADDVYDVEAQERIVLTRSYRSTYEITEFTKPIVEGNEEIIPFNRHGEKPTLTLVNDELGHREKLAKTIKALQEKGHETIAVICKTAKESDAAYDALSKAFDVRLVTKKTSTFEKGILVLPSYLAKGIEFDAVLIYNASKDIYTQASEAKLLYTACTRAMHELHLFSIGEKSSLLEKVPSELYTVLK
ncbi:DNA helicase-2/ATP-dependent DNA helicase PcrA [Pullulanibacillus pueri]|uniref:Helicase IV n=1 Tax=Pullulanibacillus pueri TaxID=1437324 RepID=A0A8J3EL38_9BACL|nr:RNA polymerase recycling motor HelD [Pullulanibacillus pueri]MBM7681088.1 DNA helicase-2/ATP-dependent DNA helicase PcrA [Pullulanibacillus pueri]GGH77001.1 helicase IV [Pullulanibacillus pueri]